MTGLHRDLDISLSNWAAWRCFIAFVGDLAGALWYFCDLKGPESYTPDTYGLGFRVRV